jgi:hypothetical protein
MNTLAYLASSSAMKEKSFITLTPGGQELLHAGLEGLRLWFYETQFLKSHQQIYWQFLIRINQLQVYGTWW